MPAFTRSAMLLIYALACAGAAAQVPGTPERQRELVRMVRQD